MNRFTSINYENLLEMKRRVVAPYYEQTKRFQAILSNLENYTYDVISDRFVCEIDLKEKCRVDCFIDVVDGGVTDFFIGELAKISDSLECCNVQYVYRCGVLRNGKRHPSIFKIVAIVQLPH